MRPRAGLADAPAKRGDLRAEAAESMVKSVRKVASADCRRARATDFSLINDRVFFEFAGGHPPAARNFQSFRIGNFQSFRVGNSFIVECTLGVPAATGPAEDGGCAGIGRCWHRGVGRRCSPTSAGVRRRPEPSLQHGCAIRSRSGPGRTPALSPPAGQLAPRAAGRREPRVRTVPHGTSVILDWKPYPRGTSTCTGGRRRHALPAAALLRRSWVATAAAG